ncbi:MAG: sigma-70 family RNA polymerase sigma factor [Polyangiaceae bacterium]|nr:sigma-70 family RNA polymerase sigma factor [Polyangiaceae bacterium]
MALETETLGVASAAGRASLAPNQSLRLRALVDQYFDFAWRSLRRLGVPEPSVDDAAQQLFVVLATKLDAVDPECERSFVFGTAVRIASDYRRALRLERERRSGDTGALSDPLPAPDELLDHKRARELLDRLLDALPMELRTVLILAEGEGMTMSEIAGLCEIPRGTVASRLRRARSSVLGMLEQIQARTHRTGESS